MASKPIEEAEIADSVSSAAPALSATGALAHWVGANRMRLLKFASVGASGVVVNLAIFELCYRLVLPGLVPDSILFVAANALGFLVSVFTNFVLNDLWTWGDRIKGQLRIDWFKRLTKYYLTASLAGGVQLAMAWLSLELVWSHLALNLGGTNLSPTLSVLTGIGCGMVLNFAASHLWAFRDVS